MSTERFSLFLHGSSNFNVCKEREFLFSVSFRHHVSLSGLLFFPNLRHKHYDLLLLKQKVNLQHVQQLPELVHTASKGLNQD